MGGSSGGIRAGKAYVELYGDDSPLQRMLAGSQKRMASWGKSLMGAGSVVTAAASGMAAPLAAAVNSWQEMGSALDDVSQRTGASAESLSTLGYAAKLSGSDMETLEKGLRKMSQTIAEGIRGNEQAETTLRRVGLRVGQLKDLSPEDQFKAIANGLTRIQDPALRSATAMELFGKSGAGLLPMLSGGAAGIEQLQAEARRLGLEMKSEDVAAAAAFGDQLDSLWAVVKRGVFAIGAGLGPALTNLVDITTGYISRASQWIDQNRGLVVSIAQMIAIVAGVGIALMAAGAAASVAATGIGLVSAAVGAVITGVVFLGTAFGALFTPVGAIVAGIVAATAAILYFTGYGGELITWLTNQFSSLSEIFGKAWGAIVSAISRGDLGKAAEIAWLTMKLAFFTATKDIYAGWLSFCKVFLDLWDTVTFNLARLFADPWNTIQHWWNTGTTAMMNGWSYAMTYMMDAFSGVKSFIAKGILALMNLLKGEQITAGFEVIDDMKKQEIKDRRAARDGAIKNRNKAAAKKAAVLDSERNDAAKIIDEGLNKKRSKREKDLQASIDASTQRLEDLRGEWDESIKTGAEAVEKTRPGGPKGPSLPSLDGLQEAEKMTSTGTFNAAAVRGLGGSSIAERIAAATEETAANTKKTSEAKPSRIGANDGLRFAGGD